MYFLKIILQPFLVLSPIITRLIHPKNKCYQKLSVLLFTFKDLTLFFSIINLAKSFAIPLVSNKGIIVVED